MWDRADTVVLPGEPSSWGGAHHPGWEWMMGLHGMVWLVLAALAVFALVSIFRSGRASLGKGRGSALAVLATRYAQGEIDRGDYLERKGDLG